jgi:hypothetical protein
MTLTRHCWEINAHVFRPFYLHTEQDWISCMEGTGQAQHLYWAPRVEHRQQDADRMHLDNVGQVGCSLVLPIGCCAA